MSTSTSEPPYHHGDLHPALIEAALAILSEAGFAGLSLRAVAGRAGVSPMAPYRHFADKAALLAAVAALGFRRLATRLEAALAGVSPRQGLAAQGIAYVRFACAEPALFRLMFGPEIIDKPGHPELAEAGEQAHAALRRAVAACVPGGQAADVALAAWSLVHGLSMLAVDGRFGGAGMEIDTLAGRITRLFADGLAASGIIRSA